MVIHKIVTHIYVPFYFTFSCTSCVQNRECNWCPLTLGCYLNSGGCNGQVKTTVSNSNILDSSLTFKIICGLLFKEYWKKINRLYDIAWFGAVYS
jgi:hypothetical protein